MLHSAFKALVCFTASLCLTPVPAFPTVTAPPNPDGSRRLPFAESWTPGTRIDSLVESLVVGRWEIDSRELGQKEDPQYRYRWVFHFSPDHTVEMRIWLRDGYGGAEGDPPVFFGLEQTGDWFIQDGKIGIISRHCHGLTAPAQRECDIETDAIGDTSYQILQRRENEVFLSSEESGIVHFSFKGRDRDMSAPAYWPAGISLRATKPNTWKRPKAAGWEIPTFDAKGRLFTPGELPGETGGGNGAPTWNTPSFHASER
jgi:hypothetical protein